MTIVASRTGASIAELRAATGMTKLQVLWLVATGRAELDLDQVISPDTILFP